MTRRFESMCRLERCNKSVAASVSEWTNAPLAHARGLATSQNRILGYSNRSNRMILRFLFIALALCRPAVAALELTGFFVLSDNAYFVFVDSESQATSGWLRVGDSFQDWRVDEFQPERDAVILQRENERIRISLRSATILEDRIAFTGDIAVGSGDVINVSQGLLRFGEVTAYPVTDAITLYLKATRLPDGNIRYDCKFEAKKDDGTIEVLSGPRITNRPDQPLSVVMGDLSFTLQPATAPVP